MRHRPLHVLRRTGRPAGHVLFGLALAMLACGGIGVAWRLLQEGEVSALPDASLPLLYSAVVTAAVGALLRAFGSPADSDAITRRDAFVLTAWIWILASVCGALPYVLGAALSPFDAVFETVSGFTTTGSTVVADIEGTLAPPLLLWRALTQWLGGMGIVVLFVAVFPRMGAGGKHMVKAEMAGPVNKGLVPRIAETAAWLYGIYVALTLVSIAAFFAAGMPLFDAVCHAFTTVATGGFSTKSASMGAFDSIAVESVAITIMLASSVSFGLYYGVIRSGRLGLIFRSREFRSFVLMVAVAFALLVVFNMRQGGVEGTAAIRSSAFAVATIATSAGFAIEDVMAFPSASLAVILALMLVGGCAGSTAGGLKVSRVALVLQTIASQVRHAVRPHVVQVVRHEGQAVPPAMLLEATALVAVVGVTLFAGSFLVAATDGVPLQQAFGATLTTTMNMGPAPFNSGQDHFADYSDGAKAIFSVIMVLGRLEFLTVLALLLPDVWEH